MQNKFSIYYVIIKHTMQIKKKISTGHILVYLNEILYLVKSLTELLKHNYVIMTQTVIKKKFFIKKKAKNCQHDKQYRKKKILFERFLIYGQFLTSEHIINFTGIYKIKKKSGKF